MTPLNQVAFILKKAQNISSKIDCLKKIKTIDILVIIRQKFIWTLVALLKITAEVALTENSLKTLREGEGRGGGGLNSSEGVQKTNESNERL